MRVNGRPVLDKPAGPYITKGVHVVEFPVAALKAGENVIEMGWAKDATRVGNVYVACDLTEGSRGIAKWRDRLTAHPEGLRIRLLLECAGR